MSRWGIIILVLLLATWVKASQAQDLSGQDLVKSLSCQGCHALAGRGGNLGPSWDGVGHRLSPEASKKQLVSPKGHMPNFAHLRPDELETVAKYISGLK